ncbi:ribonuclease HI [Pseudooceanicola sp. CBS1P-1]|uniref:ribonuclease H n=1 Tax=Pseudooceanicola albus TaxID=2692189 RepID=A0A6L7G4T1_9RHOB|nr:MULTISPECIES: ribonuclease H [Pseudooceanicola]MBT9385453.1 ribonuclease HI [Pseudooceanicola endophyticus]MXN19135.1 ribonuclease HI [Pseudooceanicola albus]
MDDLMKSALAAGTYVAVTDGSCQPNPGPGGCAYRLHKPDGTAPVEASNQSLDTTNNIAEMQAVINALKATPEGVRVLIFLDSEYVKNGCEKDMARWAQNGWKTTKGKGVKNREKWETIANLMVTRDVAFQEVAAHSRDPEHERVDQLAKEAAERASRRRAKLMRDAGE